MKTKLGISAGLLGAFVYFMGIFGGYLALVLIAGYILFFESDVWLRKTAVKAFIICLGFSIIDLVLGVIPDFLSTIEPNDFNVSIFILISRIFNAIIGVINIAQNVLLILFAFISLNKGNINIGFIDKFIDKHMRSE